VRFTFQESSLPRKPRDLVGGLEAENQCAGSEQKGKG